MANLNSPWLAEPNEIDLIDQTTGLPIALRRGPVGHWCGYIGIAADHLLHGKSYSHRIPEPDGWRDRETTVDQVGVLNVFCFSLGEKDGTVPLDMLVRCHGGLTFSGEAFWKDETRASWWFGFDCAHAGDHCPTASYHTGETYRDAAYVIAAAKQAAADLSAFADDAGSRLTRITREIARSA